MKTDFRGGYQAQLNGPGAEKKGEMERIQVNKTQKTTTRPSFAEEDLYIISVLSQEKPGSTVFWEGEGGILLRKSPRATNETTLCDLEEAPLPR